jgi:hypothetical protein
MGLLTVRGQDWARGPVNPRIGQSRASQGRSPAQGLVSGALRGGACIPVRVGARQPG